MAKRILKSNEELALLLTFRQAKTEMGKRVQAAVLARIEISMMIADSVNDLDACGTEPLSIAV